ncbi:SRPBCC family protein [Paenibacillus assamensis]|uniref:SRPBCC family protein n=1 Tax=Paenibacillus assamensis TaxID=311244 RepID=UPI0003FE7FA8|nr:SRPBCC domain-containing protein [Paenibacillus assamensis]
MVQSQRSNDKPIGLTASSGYQVGIRRTFSVQPEQMWNVLLSKQGLNVWLGPIESLVAEAGEQYHCENGTKGELRVVKPLQQLRLTWQPHAWHTPSTLQIRLISNKNGTTTISFHQEKLEDVHRREEMKLHWEQVIVELAEMVARA